MTKLSFFLVVVCCLGAVACKNMGYKKTSSGLMYKVVSSGDGAVAKDGEFVKIHFTQKLNDSLLGSSWGKMPTYQKVEPVQEQYKYTPMEAFQNLHKGDSIVVVQLVDSMMKKSPGGLPPFMKKGDKLTTAFRVIDVFASEEAARTDSEKEFAKERVRQEQEMVARSGDGVKEVEAYLAKNKINARRTGKGTFVSIQDPGNGPAADSGKYLTVRYTGKLLQDNKVFESNMDNSRPPFSFVVGTGSVIPGWDEGLKLLKEGGKATLYIPGFLAYGPQQGPGGKTFEPLIFDVVVVDVADAPPATPEMPMPPQPGGR